MDFNIQEWEVDWDQEWAKLIDPRDANKPIGLGPF